MRASAPQASTKGRNRTRPRRASTEAPKTHMNNTLPMMCHHEACRNCAVNTSIHRLCSMLMSAQGSAVAVVPCTKWSGTMPQRQSSA